MLPPQIIIHCALAAEAKSLINRLALRRLPCSNPAKLFGSEDGCLLLLISGVGIMNSAMSCSWLAGERDCSQALWLNTGIAGHSDFSIGSLCWASSVEGVISDKKHYSYLVPGLEAMVDNCTPLLTCLQPQTNYAAMNGLVDMEAWGMYQCALRITSLEKIHSVKIISDNSSSDLKSIDRDYVIDLYNKNLERIELIIRLLLAWSKDSTNGFALRVEALHKEIISQCRASVSQQHQIADLLRRALALQVDSGEIKALFAKQKPRAAITCLNKMLDSELLA